MKYQAYLIILFSFLHAVLFSQSCLPDGIVFEYQEEIDSFQVNYPGCTRIDGNVNIWSNDITNLDGLSVISHIGGKLYIHNCDLNSLSGLQNIDTVEGKLVLKSNYHLNSITGLEGLTYVGGNLDIFNNPELKALAGIENLSHVGGFLSIAITDSLKNLTGLENLITIGGDLIIGSSKALESLDGLENLTSIGGALDISFNYELISLAGLESLDPTTVMDLYVNDNQSLGVCSEPFICNYLANPAGSINIYKNAPGCNDPSQVAGSCGITLSCLPYGNYFFFSQADIDNFPSNYPNCADIQGDISIRETDVTNLNGLNMVTSIDGDLEIDFNDSLVNLSGLDNLHYIDGSLDVNVNDAMNSMTGLENLDSIGDYLSLQSNNLLVNLTGLESLTYIGGVIEIAGNDALKNLNGLNSLHIIDGGLIISHNNSLADLEGLNNLDTIWTGLSVWSNNALVSLAALENTKLISAIEINYNQLLTSLSGLDNIDPDSIYWLKIINNILLSDCDVRSICNYLAVADTTVDIYSNDFGCLNREEVETACGVGIPEDRLNNICSIFPDPVKSFATFHLQINEPGQVKIVIFNNIGQEVGIILDEFLPAGNHYISWNARNLSAGLYFYRTSTIGNRQTTIGKLIKN